MVNQNLLLLAYIVPIGLGTLLMTKAGQGLGKTLSGRQPLLKHARRRHMFGLNLVVLAGFVVSVHTLWISNKISEGGNVCSSATVFSCDDVLGNAQYNTDPVFGLPWGDDRYGCVWCVDVHHEFGLERTGCFVGGKIPQLREVHDARWCSNHCAVDLLRGGHGEDLPVLYDGPHSEHGLLVWVLACWKNDRRRSMERRRGARD